MRAELAQLMQRTADYKKGMADVFRPSISCRIAKKSVDARNKAGHDGQERS
jgi:hypothetical protein